jgi:hypothetical protein
MKNRGKRCIPLVLITCGLVFGLVISQDATAGDLYRLDMRYEGPGATVPVHVQVNVWEGGNCDHLKGSSEADFDGTTVDNLVCDDVVCITDIYETMDGLVVRYTANGYDNDPPKFKASSCFEVIVDGNSSLVELHTSCSQPIYIEQPYPADPEGNFFVEDGEGDCFDDGLPPVDCPEDHNLYWLAGEFRVSCPVVPTDLTFTVYESDHFDEPEGIATAHFDGSSLSSVTGDAVALLYGAHLEGEELVVQFEAFGFDHSPPHFKAETSLELDVSGCGTFLLNRYHTSCSQPIQTDIPLVAEPSGTVTITNFCGCEENVVSSEQESWGGVKALYR